MDRFPEERPKTVQAGIAYRVECLDPTNKCYNQTLVRMGLGGMKPRGEDLIDGSWWKTLEVHLTWVHEPTPFTSFFDCWKRAMGWMKSMLDNGGTDIVVVAVWLEGLPWVYDGSEIARRLCYTNISSELRERLEKSHGELLVHGAIPADEHRVLACFSADSSDMRQMTLSSPSGGPSVPRFSARVPQGHFVLYPDTDDAMIWLRAQLELVSRDQVEGDVRFLIFGMALRAHNLRLAQ